MSQNQEPKLYDLDKGDYPKKRGSVFRSIQVFECDICGALTNKVIIGGFYPDYGIKVVCPNSTKCWHHELEIMIRWLSKPHPRSYKDELSREIKEEREKHRSEIKNDLEGNPDMSLPRRKVTNTFSYNLDNPCNHFPLP
jgi:hypothetical protein